MGIDNLPAVSPSIPPSIFLPSLLRLPGQSTQQISQALQGLRSLYWPPLPPPLPTKFSLPKRTIKGVTRHSFAPDSGYASAEEDSDDDVVQEAVHNFSTHASNDINEADDILRGDKLERAYAIKWLTGFITRSDAWISQSSSDDEADLRTEVLDEASSLLSAFSADDHDSEDGAVTRSFSFSCEDGSTIDVELNDAPLSERDHTCVGLQSWSSSILLAEKICRCPARFSLHPTEDSPLRILELGAGTGLLSIIAAKLLHDATLTIIATDYHPDVLENLTDNIATNFSTANPSPIIHALDWEFPKYLPPLNEPFDIILGADIIYHPEHAKWIKGCVEKLLVRPDAPSGTNNGVFWMIMALRTVGRHEGLDNNVKAIFPLAVDITSGGDGVSDWTLAVLEQESIEKRSSIGRADEGGYILYKIGWVGPQTKALVHFISILLGEHSSVHYFSVVVKLKVLLSTSEKYVFAVDRTTGMIEVRITKGPHRED